MALVHRIDNTAVLKCNGPKIGTSHGDPDWTATVGLLRAAVRTAHRHALRQALRRGDVHRRADQVTEDLFDYGAEIDPAGLHVLHLVMRIVWQANNSAAARRKRNGNGAA